MRKQAKGQFVVDASRVSLSKPKLTRATSLRFWADFWAQADEDGAGGMLAIKNHYTWRGPFDTEGRAVFVPVLGPPMLVVNVMWSRHYERKVAPGRALRPDCGRGDCIRPEHQALVARRSGRAA